MHAHEGTEPSLDDGAAGPEERAPAALPGFEASAPARTRWLVALRRGGAAGLLVLAVLAAGLRVIGHDDLWWDLAAGRHIAEHHEVPRADVFSHTFEGRHWVNSEWLSQLLFYLVYEHLGEDWITYLRLGSIGLILGLVALFCRQRARSWLLALVVTSLGAWVCVPFLDARPQLFTFLYSLVFLWVLDAYRRQQQNLLALLPVLMLLWVQQHPGYVLGLLLLVGNLLAETGKRLLGLPTSPLSWHGIRALGLTTLFSAVAILVNPWGVEAYSHPLTMSKQVGGSVFLTVAEWLPPGFFHSPEQFNPLQFWLYLFLLAVVVLPIAVVRFRAFDCNEAALAIVLALFFALAHRRFIPLFVLLTLPLMSHGLRFWADWLVLGREGRRSWEPGSPLPDDLARSQGRLAIPVAIASWVLLLVLLPSQLASLRALYGGQSLFRTNIAYAYYPEQAVRFLSGLEIPGRMWNLYNWGGYLQYFLPRHKVFIDGRAQAVYDDAFYLEYLGVHWARPGWRETLQRRGVTFALLHTASNAELLQAMEEEGWVTVFRDGTSAILIEPDAAETAGLVAIAEPRPARGSGIGDSGDG